MQSVLKKILAVLLVASVLSMTGCWDAFAHGFASGYYGPSYQPTYYQPQQHPHGYYPSDYQHYINDAYGIDDAYHHQQHHGQYHY